MSAIAYPRDAVDRLYRELCDDEVPSKTGPQAAEDKRRNDLYAPIPTREHLDELLSVAFVASLKTEEVRPSTFALAYISPAGLTHSRYTVVTFAQPRELNAADVAKIAAGTDPYATSVCVYPRNGRLEIWGLAHMPDQPMLLVHRRVELWEHSFLLLRTPSPGVLYVHYHVRLQMLYAHGTLRFELAPGRLTQIFRERALVDNGDEIAQIVTRIRRNGRGGTILLTDPRAAAAPIGLELTYAFAQPSTVLKDALAALEKNPDNEKVEHRAAAALDFVSELSQVDGAVHLGADLTVYGYGGKILVPLEGGLELLMEDPETGAVRRGREADLPGMRHRSAASFCALQTGPAVAVVVSQDGDVSFFGREPDGRVRKIGPFVLGVGIAIT
jgi:hypothetical protein